MHCYHRSIWLSLFVALWLASPVVPVACPQTAPTPAKALTVERIYSEPSLSGYAIEGIEWRPDGKEISFIRGAGRRGAAGSELVVMDAATGKIRVLVDAEKLGSLLQPEEKQPSQATGLGRVTPENYFWAPDGGALLFKSGGNLVWLDLKTMASKKLVSSEEEVADPKFSPDSRWVSYVRGANLWVVNVATGESRPLTSGGNEEVLKGQLDWVYPEELDLGTAYWWSPDSKRIAFLEMDERPVRKYPIIDLETGGIDITRYPQAGDANPVVRVGVVDLSGDEPRWMDTGNNPDVYLPRVEWLPDAKRLAIERLNRGQTRLDLLIADATSGNARTILTDTDKFWINVSDDDPQFFSDSHRFLWSSERTGYRHIYVYDTDGRLVDQLTHGDWEVTGIRGFGPSTTSGVVLDEKRGYVYFPSNKDNPIEAQFYRVSIGDKSIARVTREAGSHAILFAPDALHYVDTYSNAMTPPREDLSRADGTHVAAINENRVPELAEYHLSPVEFLKIAAADGAPLHAMLIKPPSFDPSRRYPVIVYVYGGPQAQEVKDEWDSQKYFLWKEMMAQKGFLSFTVDNRGSFTRGHNFETSLYHHFGRVELEDQLAGVKYLKSLPYVDGTRIGIWGGSYGGYMTLEAMFNAAGVFKAGAALAPVTDWRLYDTIYTERYMGRPQENPEGYRESSPVNQAGRLRGKLLIAHGTGDDNVHFANTTGLLERLISEGKYPELMVFPGRGHGMSDHQSRIVLFERMTRFFLDNLR